MYSFQEEEWMNDPHNVRMLFYFHLFGNVCFTCCGSVIGLVRDDIDFNRILLFIINNSTFSK